jgi:hypothetical protein
MNKKETRKEGAQGSSAMVQNPAITMPMIAETMRTIVRDEVVTTINASETRVKAYVDEKAENLRQGMIGGFDLVHEKIEENTECMEIHAGNSARILNKMEARITKLKDTTEKLRHRTA